MPAPAFTAFFSILKIRRMRNKNLQKFPFGCWLPCVGGLAFLTSAHAQTTNDAAWQRMMSDFQKAMAQTNAAALTPTTNDLTWQRMMVAKARLNTPATTNDVLTAAAPTVKTDKSSDWFTFRKVSADDDWTRHFRIGAIVGLNIKANFKEDGVFHLPGGTGNGTYDDGYVQEDQTGNAGGYTSNWGYNNASQYDPTKQTLTYHKTSSYATAGESSDSGEPFPGFEMAYGGNLFYWDRVRVGWELGFDLLPMNFSDNQTMSASVKQTDYAYDTSGITLPGAPYHGGSSGLGPLLPDSPSSTSFSESPAGTVSGSRKLDAMLYAIRLGPTFYWNFSENLSMSAGIGPVLGVVSADYKYDEIITTGNGSSHNVGRFSSTDVIFGGNLNATLLYHTVDNGRPVDLYLSAEYMPMENASFSNGGREAKINLEGQIYFSAGVNWAF
jgi:hypothetical protein